MARIRKIALVQTVRAELSRQQLGLGTPSLKAYLDLVAPGQFEVEIYLDSDFIENRRWEDASFDMVGVGTASNLYNNAKRIAREVKAARGQEVITLVGGAHISALPESLNPDFDYGVIGEGEQTLHEFLLAHNAGASQEAKLAIPGIIGWQDGAIRRAPKRKLLDSVEHLPSPDRTPNKQYGITPQMILSRGCPFNCDFCTNNLIWERRVRRPSPEKVVREMADLIEAFPDMRVIQILDDVMFFNKTYLSQIIDIARSVSPKVLEIPKYGYSQVNVLTPDFVRTLLEFNVGLVQCGFESGSDRVLGILKSGHATVQQNQRAIDVCTSLGLPIGGNLMLASPDETMEDLQMTLDFVRRNKDSGNEAFFSFTTFTPFPGTRYWDMIRESLGDTADFDWRRLEDLGYSGYRLSFPEASIRDWWASRKERGLIYMGSYGEEDFQDKLESNIQYFV